MVKLQIMRQRKKLKNNQWQNPLDRQQIYYNNSNKKQKTMNNLFKVLKESLSIYIFIAAETVDCLRVRKIKNIFRQTKSESS